VSQLDDTARRLNTRSAWRWRGRYHRGAMSGRRATRRAEAEERNARTLPDRRRAARRAAA
jgi:hypothetical protein